MRPYHQIRFLAVKHDVDLISFSGDGTDEWDARERLRKLCQRVQMIPIVTPPQAPSRVANLLHRRPLALRRFYRKDLFRRLNNIALTNRYDLIFVYSTAMAPYLAAFPLTPRIVDLVDVGSLRWLEYANLSRFPRNAVYRAESARLLGVETRAADVAQRVLFACEREAEAFRRFVPGNGRIASLKTPVNPRAPLPGPWAAEPTILLTGHLDHFPNADAAVRFLAEVFPRVRKKVRTARLILAGRNPSGEVRLLANRPEIRIAHPKADYRVLFRDAWVVVAPHRMANGVRNEILEAMAAGVPVVATEEAARGLDFIPDRDFRVAKSPSELADEIVRLLLDPMKIDELGKRGRKAVQNNYSHWSVSLRLAEIVNGATSEALATP